MDSGANENTALQRTVQRPPPNDPTIGECRLCRSWGELRRSHVLPDMAYNDVIDTTSHPRMIVVRDTDEGRVSDKSHQTGFRERLLWPGCEARFSKYESYAARHLLNVSLPHDDVRGVVTLRVDDYSGLKLFLLSLLWRVGAARGDFFRCVRLGPHEERLRAMLDAENPGEPDEYGCLVTPLLPEPGIPMERIITMPSLTRVDGHNGCLLVFRGMVFQFFISRHGIAAGVERAFLNKNGEMIMMWARGAQFPPLRQLWHRCMTAVRREADKEANNKAVPAQKRVWGTQ